MSQRALAKQRDELRVEGCRLRSELLQVKENCDRLAKRAQDMSAENMKFLESWIKFVTCFEDPIIQEAFEADNETRKMVKEMQIYKTDLERRLIDAKKLQKELHNTILELKGNIRVFCRVRPTLPERRGAERIIVSFPTDVENRGRGIELMQSAQNISFTFDKVFDHEASQEDVFVEISDLVQSALDGYKVCIFAYGQTGSGKTYTMMGKPEDRMKKGLIPRSLEQIFEACEYLKSEKWTYTIQASMLEIYNETIRDLLPSNRCASNDGIHIKKQFSILHDQAGNICIPDLTVADIRSINEVYFLLKQATQNRSIGKTNINDESSRSHFVLTIRVTGINESTKQSVAGILNLIDLASSQRISKSGSIAYRMKETRAINKSLSALNDVIFSIANKADHVPYRNSQLTYLLQPCLGGDSKTLMFVNISPEASSASESIRSLRFAARVNACELGVSRRHK